MVFSPTNIRSGLVREYDIVKRNVKLPWIIGFPITCACVLYACYLPFRKLAWYHHTPLHHYWPKEYRTSPQDVVARLSNGDEVPLKDLMERNHLGVDINSVSISREKFVEQCDGCIAEPLRLKDAIMDWTPDWSRKNSALIMSEVLQGVIIGLAVIHFCILPLLLTRMRVSAVSMVIRVVRIAFTLTLVRSLVYLTTSLPGPANHCQPKMVAGGGGKDVLPDAGSPAASIFAFVFEESCGDLVFSGHTSNMMSILVCLFYYANKMYGPGRKLITYAVCLTGSLLVATNLFLMICARNHYTVDILCSILIVVPWAVCDILLIPDWKIEDTDKCELKSDHEPRSSEDSGYISANEESREAPKLQNP